MLPPPKVNRDTIEVHVIFSFFEWVAWFLHVDEESESFFAIEAVQSLLKYQDESFFW